MLYLNILVFYIISGLILVLGIGTIAYFAWPKNKSVESKEQTNSKKEIQNYKRN